MTQREILNSLQTVFGFEKAWLFASACGIPLASYRSLQKGARRLTPTSKHAKAIRAKFPQVEWQISQDGLIENFTLNHHHNVEK